MKLFERLVIAVAVCLLFIVIFPARTQIEPRIEAQWAAQPATAAVNSSGEGAALAVQTADGFAYLTQDGAVLYRGRTSFGVALSQAAFVNYSQNPGQLVVQSPDGAFVNSIPTAGHALFVNDRLLVFAASGSQLLVSDRGRTDAFSTVNLPSVVTVIDAAEDLLAVGLASGGTMVLRGREALVRMPLDEPSVAVTPVVHDVALAANGSRLAIVASDPELTITVYDVTGDTGIPIARRTLDPGSPRRAFLSPDGSAVGFVEASSEDQPGSTYHAILLDPATGDFHRLDVNAPPVAMKQGAQATTVLTAGTEADPQRGFSFPMGIVVATELGMVPVAATWAADTTALETVGDTTVIRVDDRYLAYRLVSR